MRETKPKSSSCRRVRVSTFGLTPLEPALQCAEALRLRLQRPDRQRGPLAGQYLQHVPARAERRVHVVFVASVAVAVGLLMLHTTGVTDKPGLGAIIYGAMGLAVTYGGRMWRMLRQQARGWGELA